MLRLFRALRSVSGFTVTVFSFAQVVPLMARYFAVLFCILFSYAVLGECCAGGDHRLQLVVALLRSR